MAISIEQEEGYCKHGMVHEWCSICLKMSERGIVIDSDYEPESDWRPKTPPMHRDFKVKSNGEECSKCHEIILPGEVAQELLEGSERVGFRCLSCSDKEE